MLQLIIESRAEKFISSLPPKHQRQLKDSILALAAQPIPQDAKILRGYENYWQISKGEYRIVYRYDAKKKRVIVVLVGKRNDDHVYRVAGRILQ